MSHGMSVNQSVSDAVAVLSRLMKTTPRVGIVLGSGLGRMVDEVDIAEAVSYDEIPGFPGSTSPGHSGRLVLGSWCSASVVVLQGRAHLYEGHRIADVTFPVRVLQALGVRRLVLTNAAGGLNPRLSVGDLVLIDGHINFTGARFHAAPEAPPTGFRNQIPRLYEPALIERALSVCRRADIGAHRGTYVAVTGPNYETRAEYRMFRALGGDVIGMSTIPEAVVAAGLGLEVLALSTVTNVCQPDQLAPTDGQAIVHAAESAAWKLRLVLHGILDDRDTQGVYTQP